LYPDGLRNARVCVRQGIGLCAMAAIVLIAGCRQDMHNQPKFVPQRGTDFFLDGRSARAQVIHTVARGQVDIGDFFHTGLQDGKEVDALPFPATLAVLERGQEQFNTYCTPCHSRVGNGAGMIVERGYKPAGNFHDAKRLAEPLSHYFYVITNGYGAMPDYAAQVEAADRWAIAAYIRALQLSQNAKQSDVPAGVGVQQLSEVAAQQGLPASYAQPWRAPATAVHATPPGPGTPAMAPAENITTPDASRHPQYQLENGDSPNATGVPAAAPAKTRQQLEAPAKAGGPK
jgi:mono/diheme cytochrome c family protein